ncbi:aminotransferase class I/II-fold pyridoxal phosphate-dependent enzyme [Bianquea renquensis]|uniref:Aminotransferase n=1 Tax=Bianquea renquensis TaxID=2763661 RepID=A0A926DN69_9FIRM|nr:aminotransferase class I/II-fold pyridoxal phosphate-dependent enzyme [Bianquea renquensis]MBC8542078.1 aminotransferase class I/II-fold pyridoxal phosphate-dependent enzyme [Bianquea renquensis]
MRDFVNPMIKSIPPSGIRRFFDIAAEMEDVISLGVGEPDFDTPWNVREEGIYSLERGKTTYTANAGLKQLRDEIQHYTTRKYGMDYDPAHEILITVGGSEAIDIGLRAILEPGDEVLIPEPSFVSYKPCTILAGGVPVPVAMKEENEFKLMREDLEAAVTPRSKVLIFPFPNNPTGSIMTKDEMGDIARFVVEHDLFVMSDEIYAELTYSEDPHVSIATLEGMRERTLVINGFSKAFSMTGWRLGYAMGPESLLKEMTKIHQFAIMCAPTTSQYAAIEAMRNCDVAVEEMRREYNRRRRLVVNGFRSLGFDCSEPYGAFYVFPSIKKFGMTSEEFCKALLEAQRVAVVPGSAFGDSGEGFIRVSYAYSQEDLKKAIAKIGAFVDTLK